MEPSASGVAVEEVTVETACPEVGIVVPANATFPAANMAVRTKAVDRARTEILCIFITTLSLLIEFKGGVTLAL